MRQVPVLVPQSLYGDRNTTIVIARIYCILRGCYDVVWGTLEFPSFNFNGIFDGFCILKGMSYMMPLSRHALSLQTGLHRQFILGTVILPTLFSLWACTTHIAIQGPCLAGSPLPKWHFLSASAVIPVAGMLNYHPMALSRSITAQPRGTKSYAYPLDNGS